MSLGARLSGRQAWFLAELHALPARRKSTVRIPGASWAEKPLEMGCFQDLRDWFIENLPTDSFREPKREADYWTIIYDGQTARLKATRGLKCLARLLCHPGREFHVIELITGRQKPSMEGSTALLCASGPILDGKAKAECKRRLEELRADLDEAERFNDPERAVRVRDEMHSIAAQLASAVGLGGRNRRTGTDAERARSAVTKRVKESINNIGEAIPSLGRHLTGRIKTGYYCSYNPRPDRLVAWKF